MVIRILDNSLINKIAAGEVIERPSSVVKELLENSLDAKATEIKIEIEEAGLKKIKVTDNGSGMTKEDLTLSYKRHATSKIQNTEDLFNITSLGFRGEALASIAEVSNTKIQTKTADSNIGSQLQVEAGNVINETECAIPTGTIVEVTDLLFNLPARKKYLKSNETEFNSILKTVTKYALIRQDVSIKLIKDSKIIINSQKTSDLLNNITYIYGAEITKNLLEVNHEESGIKILGYISRPNLTRSDKSDQSLFINKRYTKNSVISDAIYNAYKTLLFIHRHPIFILDMEISPTEIDVNVHPSKEIVKLKNEELISQIIYRAISKAFQETSLIPTASTEKESRGSPIKDYQFKLDYQTNLKIRESTSNQPTPQIPQQNQATNETQEILKIKTINNIQEPHTIYKLPQEETQTTVKEETQTYHPNFGPFRILGQINKSFIVAETPEGLSIIDQHAAEERVNYENFLKQKSKNAIKTQNLLKPQIIELSPTQRIVAINNKELLNNLGFDIEDFANNTIKLSSIPEVFGKMKTNLIIDIINEIEKNNSTTIQTQIEERIIKFACRASIKAGDELTIYEMNNLLKRLAQCQNPYSCPHGRPTVINFTISDLEKKFKRK